MHLLLINANDATSGTGLENAIHGNIEDQQEKIIPSCFDDKKPLQLLIKKESITRTDNKSILGLNDNDLKILSLLQQENDNCRNPRYTFAGLMRRLNMHQQSLARSLHRLQKLELIQKFDIGFGLIAQNKQPSQLSTHHNRCDLHNTKNKNMQEQQLPYFQLLQTRVPISISDEELIQRLVGKWFSKLRWIGLMKNEDAYWLQWINIDNSFYVDLYVVSKYITIETNAITDEDKIDAMLGSNRIYEQIVMIAQQKLSNLDVYRLKYDYEHSTRQDN